MDELRLASLLCSRLCHDLIGSIGAINNGLELLDGEHNKETQREAMELIHFAARDLRDKAQYLRVAFGLPGAGAIDIDLKRIRVLAHGLFAEGKIKLNWPEDTASATTLYPAERKLLLNLLWLAGEALARGGELNVSFASDPHSVMMLLRASGRGVKLRADLRETLEGQSLTEELDAKSAQAYLTHLLIESVGATLSLEEAGEEADLLVIRTTMPR